MQKTDLAKPGETLVFLWYFWFFSEDCRNAAQPDWNQDLVFTNILLIITLEMYF